MPENASNIPLDDEDILDLTVIAEPGTKSDGPPEPGMDFGADLDALLDSLGAGGEIDAPAPPAPAAPPPPPEQAAPPAQAAPIADQTPVDHAVDPNEELAMPEMSDIDSLLAELGADIPLETPAPGPEAKPALPAEMPEAASAPMPEFDAILAQAQAADAAKAAQSPAPPTLDFDDIVAETQAAEAVKPAPAAPALDFDDIVIETQTAEAAKPAPAAAPMPEFDAILAQAQAAEASKAEEEAPAVEPEPEPVADLFDAALSAAQPEPEDVTDAAVPAAAKIETPVVEIPPAEAAIPPASVATEDPFADAATENGDGSEEEEEEEEGEDIDLNELDALLDDILATAPEMSVPASSPAAVPKAVPVSAPDVIPVPDQALMPVPEDIAALLDRVQRFEEEIEALKSQVVPETMVVGLVDERLDAKIAAMFEPGSTVMDRIVNEIRGQFAEGVFNEDLEKMAAAAAAKVIREEIAGLMAEE